MNDFIVNMAISTLITLLKSLVNDDSKKKWKKPLLKVFKEISKQYGDDPDFKS
ncbi:hypothetical protein BH10ACI1_BH10ACI1_25380 [soil metagenome]